MFLIFKVILFLSSVYFSASAQENSPASPTKDTVPAETPKEVLTVTQYTANDINFRGSNIFGDKLSRRNLQPYSSFAQSWFLSTNVKFDLPVNGLKLYMTSHNPLENRSDRDTDFRFQSSPGGTDETSRLNSFLSTGNLTFDPNAVKFRKEHNGLRDVFVAQIYYEWTNFAGGFKTGFFILSNQNYPTKFNMYEYVFGWEIPLLKVIHPEWTTYYRLSSELNGLNNGNIHSRLSFKHEFFKESILKFTPALEAGYQAPNNSTDRRVGVSDVTLKLQFSLKSLFLNLIDAYRPNMYMYDNDRYFPKTGVFSDINPNDGRTVDPSKTAGAGNKTAIDGIEGLPVYEVIKSAMVRDYQEQKIPKHVFIVQIGYNIKF